MLTQLFSSPRSRVIALMALPVLLYLLLFGYRTVRWKMWIWLPSLISATPSDHPIADADKHVIFVLADHYEPGAGDAGSERHQNWLEAYRPIADRHFDDAGNKFQYSWFYPFEHGNDEVLASLCKMSFEGYGEVELHWHHPQFSNETFPDRLDEAIAWFQSYGALLSADAELSTNFAFIHGNWALDNSKYFCGVSRELEILQSRGCYADLTFSTIGTDCQPSTINQIYYVEDSEASKSYDTGTPAIVGMSDPSGFMIFEGPIGFDWLTLRPEYGAVGEMEPTAKQIHQWIDADIHVAGRPEWVFVKTYAHGIQTRTTTSGALAGTLENLEAVCKERGITLHYMTAREAFNLIKAAEAGESGDPEAYRDFQIPQPATRFFHSDVPVQIESITDGQVRFAEPSP